MTSTSIARLMLFMFLEELHVSIGGGMGQSGKTCLGMNLA